MIKFESVEDGFDLILGNTTVRGSHKNQLKFWDFVAESDNYWHVQGNDYRKLEEVVNYFRDQEFDIHLDNTISLEFESLEAQRKEIQDAAEAGMLVKKG